MNPKRLKQPPAREYARGYSAGRRNVPFSLLRNRTPAVVLGWGAGQAWLYRQIADWPNVKDEPRREPTHESTP